MRWKPTWLLVCVTALLFGFIYFIERKSSSTSLAPAPPPLLVSIKPETISTIKLERADKFTLRLQKTNQTWHLTYPLFYPAQSRVVDELLQKLAAVTAPTYITPQELASSHNSITNYGLDTPAATLSLFQDSVRTEILFGARTSVGDHIYVQLYN